MLCYHDGQEVCIGDEVDFDGTSATVFAIIETKEQMHRHGFDESAVGFQTKQYGEVYQSTLDPGWDESVVLLKRA